LIFENRISVPRRYSIIVGTNGRTRELEVLSPVAIAWLDLAREGSVTETELRALSLREKLSPAQIKKVESLKKVLRPH